MPLPDKAGFLHIFFKASRGKVCEVCPKIWITRNTILFLRCFHAYSFIPEVMGIILSPYT